MSNQSINAKRVRNHRQLRRDAGLIEMRFWVKEEDRGKVQASMLPFTNEADEIAKSYSINKHMNKDS